MFDWISALETGDKIAGLDPNAAGDTELLDAALAIEGLRVRLDAGQAKVLAELKARGVCDRELGSSSTGAWLATHANLPVAVAKKRVAVAAKLVTKLTVVLDALVEGRISAEHARVLADLCTPRIEAVWVGLQDHLVGLSVGATFGQWRAEVAAIAELLDQDGAHDPNEDLATNTLKMSRTFEGLGVLQGTLTADHAVAVESALNTVADELFRSFTRDHDLCPDVEVPSRATLMALALVELCRRGQAVDLASSRPPKAEVTLVAKAEDPEAVSTEEGVRLPDGSMRTLLCDALWFPVVVNSLGVPLDLGHGVRLATATQRRAIAVRDGGCVYHGCTAPRSWCDIHHVTPYRDGGGTDVKTMAMLCRHHHGVTHRSGWTMHITRDGWFRWHTPNGHTIYSQRHGRQHPGPAPPLE